MIVYGDIRRRRSTAALLNDITTGSAHAFFDASELAQGLLDEEFRRRGLDDLTPLHQACLKLLDAVILNKDVAGAVGDLRALPLPTEIETTTPEGYAFYAVYPEAFRRVAAHVRWPSPPLVIGLRSIGVGLAAVVAAETDGQALTLRPTGHPFRRRVEASTALRDHLQAHSGDFVIVDEGPGLSGSSMAAVVELLEGLGVAGARIVLLTSHAGPPGPQASPAIRARWGGCRRMAATLDDLLPDDPVDQWFEDLIGPASRVDDLSGGAWRTATFRPPADPARERRKFRIRTPHGTYVARFAGLGRIGADKLDRATALHARGFTPQPIGLRRGFLLERWAAGSPAPEVDTGFLHWLANYIAFRAHAFPAQEACGADLETLAEMIAVNSGREASLPARSGPAIHVDGRLHPWEWRRHAAGFLKLDSLDHSCAHDLIGCQPVEYDVAGAIVEHGLDFGQAQQLLDALANAGAPADRSTLPFFIQAYVSFQQGLCSMAEATPAVAARRDRLRAYQMASNRQKPGCSGVRPDAPLKERDESEASIARHRPSATSG